MDISISQLLNIITIAFILFFNGVAFIKAQLISRWFILSILIVGCQWMFLSTNNHFLAIHYAILFFLKPFFGYYLSMVNRMLIEDVEDVIFSRTSITSVCLGGLLLFGYSYFPKTIFWYALSDCIFIYYFLNVPLKKYFITNIHNYSTSLKKGIFTLLFAVIISLISPFIFYVNPILSIQVVSIYMSLTVIVFFFLDEINNDIRNKYKHSTLLHYNIEKIDEKINELFNKQQIFLDPHLNLKTLAIALNMNRHQCSEYINRYKQVNVNRFINSFRIEYAKKLLLKHPELTIHAIGERSGFNSHSRFNSVFKQMVKNSPNEYRTTN